MHRVSTLSHVVHENALVVTPPILPSWCVMSDSVGNMDTYIAGNARRYNSGD